MKNQFVELLINKSIYDYVDITEDNYKDLFEFLGGDIKVNIYCNKCNDNRVFKCISGCRYMGKHDDYVESVKFVMSHSYDKTHKLIYQCALDSEHLYYFFFLIDNFRVTKIGEFPSYADMEFPQVAKYKNAFSDKEDFNEFKRAIGLFAHGVGIGSFIYLRRIFEKLIYLAFKQANGDGKMTEHEFEYNADKKRNRIQDKILLLKEYLPILLVDNANVYSILSKGVHELKEDECLEYFPVVESGLELILDDVIAKKNKNKAEVEYKRNIDKIVSKIKK